MPRNPDPEKSGENLFAEFSVPTYEEWMAEAVATLDGAPFEKKVMTPVYEGFDLKPLYVAADTEKLPQVGSLPGFPPYLRGADPAGYLARPWIIAQETAEPDPAEFNRVLVSDLTKGQTGVTVVCDTATLAGKDAESPTGRGLAFSTADDLAAAFAGVDLAKVPVICEVGAAGLPVLALLAAAAKKAGRETSALSGCIGSDPLGLLVQTGSLQLSLEKACDSMAAAASWAAKNAPGLATVAVSGRPYSEAGGSAVEELAFAAATGSEYMRALMDRGLSADEAAGSFRFFFALGRNAIMEIAKLRAARMVWDRIAEAFGAFPESRRMRIHGRTASFTKTVRDPYVNLLRNTIEAFSGAMGGVDSMHVTFFDEAVRAPGEFSRRVSRNVQIVLQEECHFVRPIDPLGGSYAVESLSDTVARRAWALFQEVEKLGGMAKALAAGFPQETVKKTAAKKAVNIAKRKDGIIGTNLYPNLAETPLPAAPLDLAALAESRKKALSAARAKADAASVKAALAGEVSGEKAIAAALAGATLSEISKALGFGAGAASAPQLPPGRASRDFDALRQAMDLHLEKTGSRAKIFLAGMGPVPQHKARADFSTGFFETGGFEMVRGSGFSTEEEAAAAFAAAGSNIAVICGTDKAYPEIVPKLAKLLKDKVPGAFVVLAGKPAAELEASYRAAGMDDYIFLGLDCLAMNRKLQKISGVSHE